MKDNRQLEADIDDIRREMARMPVRWGDITVPPIVDDGGEDGGTGCCCCDCTNCINSISAIVGGCAACPDGAAREYGTNIGIWEDFPELSDALQFLIGIQTVDCDAPSSSSSSGSPPLPGSGCEWSTCLITVTRPDPSAPSSSSSSSSSGPTVSGVYQWIFDAEHPDGPGFYLHFISGVDLVYDWV